MTAGWLRFDAGAMAAVGYACLLIALATHVAACRRSDSRIHTGARSLLWAAFVLLAASLAWSAAAEWYRPFGWPVAWQRQSGVGAIPFSTPAGWLYACGVTALLASLILLRHTGSRATIPSIVVVAVLAGPRALGLAAGVGMLPEEASPWFALRAVLTVAGAGTLASLFALYIVRWLRLWGGSDRLERIALAAATYLMGAGLVATAVWAALTWGRPWLVAPRPLVYAASWTLCAAAMHAQASGRMRPSRITAVLALAVLVLAAVGLDAMSGLTGSIAAYW